MIIQTTTLASLRLSPLNVRKVKPSDIRTLADDIATHGIIQSLTVYEEEDTYHVFAGGRRLRAMQLLLKDGRIEDTYKVPVVLRSKDQAYELSLAENTGREEMHIADMVKAFANIRTQEGLSAGEIAMRFGYSESYVTRLLRLGSLAPACLKALREDEIGIASAQALCITENHHQQREARKYGGNFPHQIKAFLTETKIATNSALFKFVGASEYEAEGGTITADLFSEGNEGFADNPELVETLAQMKLAAIEDDLKSQGWHRVQTSITAPNNIYSFPQIYPSYRAATLEEQAEIDRLNAEIEAIEEAEEYDFETRRERLDEREDIEKGLRVYSDDQKKIGGVMVYVDYSGDAKTVYFRAVKEAKAKDASDKTTGSAYSAPLIEQLTAIRTLAMQQEVAHSPALALDMLLDSMVSQLLHGGYQSDEAVGVTVNYANISIVEELQDRRIVPIEAQFADLFADIPSKSRFDTIQAMEENDKMQLLAGMVALTLDGRKLKGGYSKRRVAAFEKYSSVADLDMNAVWAPTAGFFGKLTKGAMLALLTKECGAEAAENCQALKKADLADAICERLPDGWLPEPVTGETAIAETNKGELSQAA